MLPDRITSLDDARALFGMIADAPAEIAMIAYLGDEGRVIGLDHVVGGGDVVALAPRRVASGALKLGAQGVMIAHNHPSGDPSPSAADLAQAREMVQALEPLDVQLVDQIVVAGSELCSLRAMGLL